MHPKVHFSCSIQNKFVPLHREPAPGMSVHRQRRVADILKRRLLALCSDALKCRKFQTDRNIATVDALRDIDYPSCANFGTSVAYIHMRMRVLS